MQSGGQDIFWMRRIRYGRIMLNYTHVSRHTWMYHFTYKCVVKCLWTNHEKSFLRNIRIKCQVIVCMKHIKYECVVYRVWMRHVMSNICMCPITHEGVMSLINASCYAREQNRTNCFSEWSDSSVKSFSEWDTLSMKASCVEYECVKSSIRRYPVTHEVLHRIEMRRAMSASSHM